MSEPVAAPVTWSYFETGPYADVARGRLRTSTHFLPPVHAKRFGSRRTACGLVAETWVKARATPFVSEAPGVCRDCVRALELNDAGGISP